MSLIHEALEKLEQEKKSGWRKPEAVIRQAPPLPAPAPEISKSHSGVIYAVIGALVFLFLAGSVYFFTRPESSQQTVPAPDPALRKTILKKPVLPLPFGAQFKLTGITQTGTEWTAIVNNRLVRKGDQINGALVESVERNAVRLNSNNQILELKLYEDSAVR